MIALNENIASIIYNNQKGQIDINGKLCFYKSVGTIAEGLVGLEEIIEELARKIGLKCAHYELTKINDTYFYISESISTNFKTANQIGLKNDNLYEYKNNLKKMNLYDEKLMQDIVKMYLFDIFVLNFDRNYDNWGINFDEENEVYILDNSLSFDIQNGVCISSKYYRGDVDYTFKTLKNSHLSTFINLEDLNNFLKIYSGDYINMLEFIYNILTPEVVLEVIDNIEIKNDITNPKLFNYFSIYTSNYYAIVELMKSRGLNKCK